MLRRVLMVAMAAMAAMAAIGLSLVARAQSLTPAPELGQWEVRNQVLVNGKDVIADARKAQLEAMKSLPADQRAQAQARLEASSADNQRECLTAKDVEGWSDPRKRLEQMQSDAPSCKFESQGVTGSTLRFNGRCVEPNGFTGDVVGSMTMTSARAWTATYTGSGRMADVKLAGGKVEPGGPVEIKASASGRWLAAQCEPTR
jgi:Protein of unknown function (DUF3617)